MKRWAYLLPLLAAAGCSGLDEGEGGVVGLEIEFPELRTLEIGEQLQLAARALDAEGNPVDATITWRASTGALSVDGTGLVTGVAAGSSDVQAVVGNLASERVGFTVIARADTIVITGDSVVVLPPSSEPPVVATLAVRVDSRTPAGPVGTRPVIFEITRPVAGETATVQLTGGVQSDTVNTTADGIASIGVFQATGQVPPDTAIVQVRANRTRGSPVPGSGQRFIILFQ